MKRVFLLLITFLHISPFFAVTLSDETKINLLTCTGGDAIYTKFGHTAVQVFDPQNSINIVFNYGAFSFYTDNFYYKFVKGETDYQLGTNSMRNFRDEYDRTNRKIFTQELNLTQSERQAIFDALIENYRPENRVYRYNFVFDNCATRPFYLIEKTLGTKLLNEQFSHRNDTYREIITHYTGKNSWVQFGIDLVFGKDADKKMQAAQYLFLPEEVMRLFSTATFPTQEGDKKLVLNETIGIFPAVPPVRFITSPAMLLIVLGILTLLLLVFEFLRERKTYILEILLYLSLGTIGIVGFYLTYFSVHPLVQHNYNLLFMNPLMLLPFALLLFKKGRKLYEKLQVMLLIYFAIALVIWIFSPQTPHLFIGACAVILLLKTFFHLRLSPKKRQRKLFHKTFILVIFLTFSIASNASTRPRLLVQVVIDGLQYENLTLLEKYFPAGGLRTILNESQYVPYMEFPHQNYGGIENVATFCTGTIPFFHGISEKYFFNRNIEAVENTLTDKLQFGIGTHEQLSPSALLSSTLSDELKIQMGEKSKVYAVGVDADATILLAGHAGDGAIWINDEQLKWASSTYYNKGFIACADQMNMNGEFELLASRKWESQFPPESYLKPNARELKKNGFTYKGTQLFKKNDPKTILKSTSHANNLVVNLALKIQEQEHLGNDQFPDILSLHLTTQTPLSESDRISSAEQEEMYIRINQDLGFLLEQLEKRVGKEKLLLVVMGKPLHGSSATQNETYQIPNGKFNIDRAAALINTYLMAKYGHERWILGSNNQQIYLNRLLIEKKEMKLEDLEKQVANFLMEFEGVQTAFTTTEVKNWGNNMDNKMTLLRNSYNKNTSGDVQYTLQPGWAVTDSNGKVVCKLSEMNATAPIFFWGMNLKGGQIQDNCNATDIAPTLCKILNVPFPNANLSTKGININR